MASSTLLAVCDLVWQEFPLDPGAVEFLVEQSHREAVDGSVRVVTRVLRDLGGRRRADSQVARENLARFVTRAADDARARLAFDRALRKDGRCPGAERAWLRRVLGHSLPPVRAGSIAQVVGKSALQAPGTAVLDLSDIRGTLSELPLVANRMGALPGDARFLKIRLGEFTYASVLAMVAQWILAHGGPGTYEFDDCPELMAQYLGRIRFDEALRDRTIKVSPDPSDWAVGLTRINRDQPTEQVTRKIVDILETFVAPDKSERQALLVLVSEMIENVHRHAEAPVDGFAVAQVYPHRLKMGITLVDAGIGVRASLSQGNASIDTSKLGSDGEFLQAAIKLHVTSKSKAHSGYGLYVLSELIARNRGTFSLMSGGATLTGYQRRKALATDVSSHAPWQGTVVSSIIDLGQELPILDVYAAMPVPPGFDEEELFGN